MPRPRSSDRRGRRLAGVVRPARGPAAHRNKAIAPAPPEPTQKLHKVLAQAGLGSRRDMERWITEGKVTVNGVRAVVGARVGAHDRIQVAGRPIRISHGAQPPRVLLYHKPEGEIVSRDDPRGRTSVFERLPRVSGGRWVAVGHLDFNSCGLLIFTTSGELADRLMHPRFEIEREYAVRVMGQLEPQHVQRLTQGVELGDGVARCDRVELRGGLGANQWCHVVLREGRNRIVRRLFANLGLTVSRLMRVRFGSIELPPRVKRGQYYELTPAEVQRVSAWLDAVPQRPAPQRDVSTSGPAHGRARSRST